MSRWRSSSVAIGSHCATPQTPKLGSGTDWTQEERSVCWNRTANGRGSCTVQKEGWIASRFLSDRQPQKERTVKPAETTVKSPPVISPSIIIQRIIAESVASYPGSCACPYSTDRGGRRCGSRSAYSKPGGYAPICFAGDVTKSMIEAYQ